MRKIAILLLTALAVPLAACLLAEPPLLANRTGEATPMQTAFAYAGIRG
jgi:hypothetical protein